MDIRFIMRRNEGTVTETLIVSCCLQRVCSILAECFCPKNRGGRMDAPLTLTTRIVATEIDKEALNTDILTQYPVSFYELTTSEASLAEPPAAKDCT